MPAMTDPMDALTLFQKSFEQGLIPVQQGRIDPSLLFALDEPNGLQRFNYMRVQDRTLTALVMFAHSRMEERHPVFNIGYAVPESHRGRGIAKSALVAGLAELSAGLASAGIPLIYLEAVIDINHVISQSVARSIFVAPPLEIMDSFSGLPALHYLERLPLSSSK
jgi:hypothetical protein